MAIKLQKIQEGGQNHKQIDTQTIIATNILNKGAVEWTIPCTYSSSELKIEQEWLLDEAATSWAKEMEYLLPARLLLPFNHERSWNISGSCSWLYITPISPQLLLLASKNHEQIYKVRDEKKERSESFKIKAYGSVEISLLSVLFFHGQKRQ